MQTTATPVADHPAHAAGTTRLTSVKPATNDLTSIARPRAHVRTCVSSTAMHQT